MERDLREIRRELMRVLAHMPTRAEKSRKRLVGAIAKLDRLILEM